MVKGRNTAVIGVRVPDAVSERIKALAERDKMTVSEWCKVVLTRAASILPDGRERQG